MTAFEQQAPGAIFRGPAAYGRRASGRPGGGRGGQAAAGPRARAGQERDTGGRNGESRR